MSHAAHTDVSELERPPFRRAAASAHGRGFTMIEIVIVLLIVGVLLSMGGSAFSMYRERTSARRAALVFSGDLMLARSTAIRDQEPVTVRFLETSRTYFVRTSSGRELVRRRFGRAADVNLSTLDLQLSGDSVAFTSRGIAQIVDGGVGVARFRAGTTTYQVRFNSAGYARVFSE